MVRARSAELQQGMDLVAQHHLLSVAIGLLRQELESLVRVLYLVSERDLGVREELITASVAGERWTKQRGYAHLTDAELVRLAEKQHPGWVKQVYGFGCSFIHLSDAHDYLCRDPFRALPETERRIIVRQLNWYHHAELSTDSRFEDVARLAPDVLKKISSNLAHYVTMLERNDVLGEGLRVG